MKIWTCGSSPRSGSRNAWRQIKNVSGASRLSKFGIFSARSKWFPVGRDWWPWTKPGYITITWRQSNNEWSGSIAAHPAPKYSECKNPLKSSRLDFLGSRRHPPHRLPSKGQTINTEFYSSLLVQLKDILKETCRGKITRGLVLTRKSPGSPGTCNPEETCLPGLPMSWSPTLFSGSGPVGLPPVLWTEKPIERSPFFVRRGGHCCRGDLVGRTNSWIFLGGLQQLEQRTKKCIELRGEYVE